MTTKHANFRREGEPAAGTDAIDQDEVTRLFAAALDEDHRAGAALVMLGGFDDTAHRASVALATVGHDAAEATPPDVLASIDRTLAALRDPARQR